MRLHDTTLLRDLMMSLSAARFVGISEKSCRNDLMTEIRPKQSYQISSREQCTQLQLEVLKMQTKAKNIPATDCCKTGGMFFEVRVPPLWKDA